ncbi:hypothetical protein CDD81_6627 [Ophiocordyceps australis]|uniref:Uncharacterized protein n=1 Tax=Ophiocordyceps australis TaxID=1399860 RepID=A0A2C5Y2C1_9HYPO|nr:hypothetical protein CDD81_6627 [Ophiocordyceps australis]
MYHSQGIVKPPSLHAFGTLEPHISRLAKHLLANSAKSGGNAMAMAASDGPVFIVLVGPCWQLAQDDARVFGAVEALLADFGRLASQRGLQMHTFLPIMPIKRIMSWLAMAM